MASISPRGIADHGVVWGVSIDLYGNWDCAFSFFSVGLPQSPPNKQRNNNETGETDRWEQRGLWRVHNVAAIVSGLVRS